MDENELEKRLLAQYGIRVEPHMRRYILKQLQTAGGALRRNSFAIMGGNARTGVPLRQMIDPAILAGPDAAS